MLPNTKSLRARRSGLVSLLLLAGATNLAACSQGEPAGLAPSRPATTYVRMDFFHRPLPDLPLPNDIATRYDASSATGRRVNASMVAPTAFESDVRAKIDRLDGWGVFQSIAIPFDGRPLDVASILAGHRDTDYAFDNDVVYLINVDKRSPRFGELRPLDVGNGNYPLTLEVRDNYWKNDTRVDTISLLFEETDEDINNNGLLDPGEDTDADGVLDAPNYLPGQAPLASDLAGRADALMTFYERETNTLLLRPMTPLDERTTYAVVVTRRLKDEMGESVGSPYSFINHTAQTEALAALPEVLPKGLPLSEVAFTYTFTTQTIQSDITAVRDGLYGRGVQAHLGTMFPPELSTIERMRDKSAFPSAKNLSLMYGEDWLKAMPTVLDELLGLAPTSAEFAAAMDGYRYVDFIVIGSFESPQLFRRYDPQGQFLPYNDQSWPPDLDRTPAPAQNERVYFMLVVPRKEISARKDGKPAPSVIVGHGYGGGHFDAIQFGGFYAKHGLATIAIDCPSHGLGVDDAQASLAKALLGQYGLSSAVESLFKDRSFDQNNDGVKDPGADFWSAYLFHTRDMVRQSALDYMQLIRVLTSFDGKNRSKIDVDGDGQAELAGDFDADGIIDIGGDATISMTGSSLGGIMSMFMGGIEPKLTAVAPMSGGGGLGDVGIRSKQGGVPEAFILRSMGPLIAGTFDATTQRTHLEQIVPDLNNAVAIPIADVSGLLPGDTMIVENLRSGERGCGYITDGGTVRAAVASDTLDPLRILLYSGPALDGTECGLKAGSKEPTITVDTWEIGGAFQAQDVSAGNGLYALTEGLGLRRANPEFRRFQGIGQMVIDPADPASFARHYSADPLRFGTDEQTGTHALLVSTMGDMNVPVSASITFGRAAGLIDYQKVDPRYGKSVNQELIDDYTVESAVRVKRYTDPSGTPVHLDVDNFSEGTDLWGTDIPRKKSPYRLGIGETDALGGVSAAVFPYMLPEGKHDVDNPGAMTDRFRAKCRAACQVPGMDDPCGCDSQPTFDVGQFMFHMIGRYFASGGTYLDTDLCQSADDCTGKPWAWPSAPMPRDVSKLP